MPRYDIPQAAPAPLRLVQRFVNTVDLERGHDWLATVSELEEWFAEMGRECKVTRTDLRRSRELREALRGLLVATNARQPFRSEDCEVVNGVVARARLTLELDASGEVVLEPRASGAHAALGEIAAIVLRALLDGTFSRLKACRNCRWAFYDYSRNRAARWCSMTLCGNRLKTRRYRARRARSAQPSPSRSARR